VRLLMADSAAARGSRMRLAAGGLPQRGHQGSWGAGRGLAPPPSGGPRPAGRGGAGARGRGPGGPGAGAPPGAAWAGLVSRRPGGSVRLGWFAGTHVVVQQVSGAEVVRWSLADRWLWASLYGFALVEEREAGAIQQRPGPLVLDRVGLWSGEPPPAEPLAEHA